MTRAEFGRRAALGGGLMVVLWATVSLGAELPPPPRPAEEPLTRAEADALRAEVACGEWGTALPTKGKYAFFEVAVIPKSVVEQYAAKPRGTLRLLREVVAKGKAEDAITAAAYAHAAVGWAHDDRLLLASAAFYNYVPAAADMDRPRRPGGPTQRAFELGLVDDLLAAERDRGPAGRK